MLQYGYTAIQQCAQTKFSYSVNHLGGDILEDKKKVTITLDVNLVKQAKLKCVQENLTMVKYIEDLIKKDLKIK